MNCESSVDCCHWSVKPWCYWLLKLKSAIGTFRFCRCNVSQICLRVPSFVCLFSWQVACRPQLAVGDITFSCFFRKRSFCIGGPDCLFASVISKRFLRPSWQPIRVILRHDAYCQPLRNTTFQNHHLKKKPENSGMWYMVCCAWFVVCEVWWVVCGIRYICCSSNFSLVWKFLNQFGFCFPLLQIMVMNLRQKKITINLVWKFSN